MASAPFMDAGAMMQTDLDLGGGAPGGGAGAGGRAVSPGPGERDDATEVIAGCREDIRALWADAGVQELLARQRIRLADSAGL